MSILSEYWNEFQASLFPRLETVLEEPLTEKLRMLVRILDAADLSRHVPSPFAVRRRGRRQSDRRPVARAFLAKAVLNLPTTEALLDMLRLQPSLRRLCGWERRGDIPSAATFSRAFAGFAKSGLGDRIHEALVRTHVGDSIVMHVSRDSTEVDAREKPAPKAEPAEKPKRRRGRPRKGEATSPKRPTRLERQLGQTPEEAVAELPRLCDRGAKRDSKGALHCWVGWKAHIDWADGAVPLTVLTTSASLHDSQAAIPLAGMTARRATSLYDLMDAAYDAAPIHEASERLGHVALIDPNRRRGDDRAPWDPDRIRRFRRRTTAERGNGRLKDEFGLRHLRVRGHAKAHLHVMFGIVALFADQVRRIFTE